ncbi:hypothetical protein H0H92_002670 [Tricholoma furcatifolium]|nr:hypothetical protein H0H92_002670 [Tricholoma furcatifolium]
MSKDELAEINGVKPQVLLRDGEEKEVKSTSRQANFYPLVTLLALVQYKAWRNQSGHPVNARTCKHLKTLFGEEYEMARLKFKNPNGPPLKSTAKPVSKAKAKPLKRKNADVDDGNGEHLKPLKKPCKVASTSSKFSRGKAQDDDNDEEVEPVRKNRKPVSQSKKSDADGRDRDIKPLRKPASRRGGKAPQDEDDDDENDDDDDDDDDDIPAANKVVPDLLLAVRMEDVKGLNPTGWWISEKLDGMRAYYDGKDMFSRLGNRLTPPEWFLNKLPKDVTLDGELFGGRGRFQSTVSIVKTINSPHWKSLTFQIFDIPSKGNLPFEQRIEFLKKLFGPGGTHACDHVNVVEQEKAICKQHVCDKLKEVEGLGGEGLMLRMPASEYEGGRSRTLLKIKSFYDAEAVVIGYTPGTGKHEGSTGGLKCKMESGKRFCVGSGLKAKQRKNPPKIGAIITYRFQGLTENGVPRFPSYVGVALDKDRPKDAVFPAHRQSGAKDVES